MKKMSDMKNSVNEIIRKLDTGEKNLKIYQ